MNIQQAENQQIKINKAFVHKAERLKPYLHKEIKKPINLIEVQKNKDYIHGWMATPTDSIESLHNRTFKKGDSVIVDFGEHMVGYLSFDIIPAGSPPDAPLHFKVTFGEMPIEVAEPFSTYDGWVSSSWLQEEIIHVDVLPEKLALSRRYSFRYVKIEVLNTSPKYSVVFRNIQCETETSADIHQLSQVNVDDTFLRKIDEVSIDTLKDCMQDVFEDGPKRDRRLWLGDLRLQALANYETFHNNDLVKRCLYLFAAVPNDKGSISANLFLRPELTPDDTYLYDYSLFFTVTLYDYFMETADEEVLADLWPLALKQVEIALEQLDDNGLVLDDSSWWSFIDWNDELNKQASSQAILIYTIKRAMKLADVMNSKSMDFLEKHLNMAIDASLKYLWDEKTGLFISGESRQISWQSQVWMILAEIFDHDRNQLILNNLWDENPDVKMNTPYMYHHYVEALLQLNEREKAISVINYYWGSMVKDGADTFWEIYNPEDKNYSPYGNNLINSFCHAWSCTPTYFIRKYKL